MNDLDKVKYILGSIQYIEEWTDNITLNEYEKDLMLSDAVSFRLVCIKRAVTDISNEFKNEHSSSLWSLLSFIDEGQDSDLLYNTLLNQNEHGSFTDFFKFLEGTIIDTPTKSKFRNSSNKKTQLINDYKYPIRTSKSIWTVKK